MQRAINAHTCVGTKQKIHAQTVEAESDNVNNILNCIYTDSRWNLHMKIFWYTCDLSLMMLVETTYWDE